MRASTARSPATTAAINALIDDLRDGALFGGRLDNLELKFSTASAMPFQRMKVRLKKEIVTLGDGRADPTQRVGVYVDPADWNALIAAPETLVIDTRNAFEVAMGTFEARVDPELKRFGEFKDLPRANSIRRSIARSRCSAPAASAAKRPAPTCSRAALRRSITSRAAS